MFTRLLCRRVRILSTILPSSTPLTVLSIHTPEPLLTPAIGHAAMVSRSYSKDKNRKKDSKRPAKVTINVDLLRTHTDFEKMNAQMEKALDELSRSYIKNLSLRSTTGAIEQLAVNVDGTDHELQELGQIVRKNPKTIVVNMIAFPQTIPAVLAAMGKSGMNLNPQQDGTTIFIPVPKVTKEHREMLSKNAKTLFLKCRDTIRAVQQDHIKRLKRPQTPTISSDDVHAMQGQITAIADKFIAQGEKTLEVKQQELNSAGD